MTEGLSSHAQKIFYLCAVISRRLADSFRKKGFVGGTYGLINTIFQLLTCPIYIWYRGRKQFEFEGCMFSYFCHWYNLTFDNERAIEIALISRLIDKFTPDKILEIGSVLPNYISHQHLVIDKYEPGRTTKNIDVTNFSTSDKYSLIIAISTLEHIGFDETPRDAGKVIRAVETLKHHLAHNGLFVATIPVGYNRYLDKLVRDEVLFEQQYFLERISTNNTWVQTTKDNALQRHFDHPYRFGNSLVIGIIGDSTHFLSRLR